MEQQLLREMVQDRDARILKLTSGLDDSILRISKSKIQLTRVKYEAKTRAHMFAEELGVLQKRQDALNREWQRLRHELKHVGSLRIYRQAMTAKSSSADDPSSLDLNALRMQCQLCKAMHYIHILRNEAILYKTTSEAQIIILKRVITNTLESKSRMEMSLMNSILHADVIKKQLVSEYDDLLNKTRMNVAEWQEELAENSSIDSEEFEVRKPIKEDYDLDSSTYVQESESEDDDQSSSQDFDDEYELLNAEERRKVFEKRRNELMGSHLGFSSSSSRQILVE